MRAARRGWRHVRTYRIGRMAARVGLMVLEFAPRLF